MDNIMGNYNFCVYKIRNTVNQHRYIGSTYNPVARRRDHFKNLRRGVHHSVYLQHAYNKYGPDAFEFEVLFLFDTLKEALECEQFCLDKLKPEYNMFPTAGSAYGFKHSNKTKSVMRDKKIGKKQNLEHIKNAKAARKIIMYDKSIENSQSPSWGTTISGDRFRSNLTIDGKTRYFGYFNTQEEAHGVAVGIRFGLLSIVDVKKRKIEAKINYPSWGTTPSGKNYRALLMINGRVKALGTYATMAEAHRVSVAYKFPGWPTCITNDEAAAA